ncbi:MAG TPA: HRDC domain-containing protein [Frankiaceae bacterium]|nr:HRDC domain-containing protein [Frankiaceae bacterium]
MTDLAANPEDESIEAVPVEAEPLPLLELSGDVPEPIADSARLAAAVAALAAGTGPVAIDAERASGYRYGQRCYLVQLRREGAGSYLIDPLGCPDLTSLDNALSDTEWILHAASQDLPCLAELGLRPRLLFDTELAARLAGYERVGLATMVEVVLGKRIDKGASSADWSQRPLPMNLLRYAALDVEVLVALRDHLARVLEEQGKAEWAREEFAAIAAAPPAVPRADRWRRTSGIHRLRSPRQLAGVRALWERRDELARSRDVAPGRVLPDAAIIDAVVRWPKTAEALSALPVFSGRSNKRRIATWFGALEDAAALPDSELPPITGPADGSPPPAHRWAERDPEAAARLSAARAAVSAIAEAHNLPVENLVEPAAVRKLAWTPPEPSTDDGVAEALRESGARAWQVALVAGPLGEALRTAVPPPPAAPPAPDAPES